MFTAQATASVVRAGIHSNWFNQQQTAKFFIAAQCFGVSAHKKVVTVNLHKLAWRFGYPNHHAEFEPLRFAKESGMHSK